MGYGWIWMMTLDDHVNHILAKAHNIYISYIIYGGITGNMKMEAEAAPNGTTDDQLGQSTINQYRVGGIKNGFIRGQEPKT